MSEKRRLDGRIIAEMSGKRMVCELFDERQWGEVPGNYRGLPRYRIRFNGRWIGGRRREYYTLTEVSLQLRKWLCRK